MKHWGYYCRHFGWRLVAAGILATSVTPARADDWGNWPVPWPPPGSTNPPSVTPPTDIPPPGSGQPPASQPPGIEVPPPGTGQPPTGADSPPEVPVPLVPPPGSPGPSSPEPASAVLGLFGVSAGLVAWRRKSRK
jgi:hypothetical protein